MRLCSTPSSRKSSSGHYPWKNYLRRERLGWWDEISHGLRGLTDLNPLNPFNPRFFLKNPTIVRELSLPSGRRRVHPSIPTWEGTPRSIGRQKLHATGHGRER